MPFDVETPDVLAELQAAMQPHKNDPWLAPEEAAELIGRSPATLKTWRRKGWGPEFFRYGPSGVRYRTSAIDAWLSR